MPRPEGGRRRGRPGPRSSPAHAATIADVLLRAALRGVDSHGVARVPRHLELLESGEANRAPRLELTSSAPGAAVLDADRTPGPVALTAAAAEALHDPADPAVDLADGRAPFADRVADTLGVLHGLPRVDEGAPIAWRPHRARTRGARRAGRGEGLGRVAVRGRQARRRAARPEGLTRDVAAVLAGLLT
ncbi:MAG TPA: Ldh family oxidoreductase [Dactylosporangium sp.]|jgi:hypothetical protein|nr:Ldh family oxidoreductase [Dactylosporangium sp.]